MILRKKKKDTDMTITPVKLSQLLDLCNSYQKMKNEIIKEWKTLLSNNFNIPEKNIRFEITDDDIWIRLYNVSRDMNVSDLNSFAYYTGCELYFYKWGGMPNEPVVFRKYMG